MKANKYNINDKIEMRLKANNLDQSNSLVVLDYAKTLCENYTKVLLLDKMQDKIKVNPNTIFILGKNSYPIRFGLLNAKEVVVNEVESVLEKERMYEKHKVNVKDQRILHYSEEQTVSMLQQPIHFCDTLIKKNRPVVFFYHQKMNRVELLYDYDNEAIKLTDLTHNCPPEFNFFGIAGVLRDIMGLHYDAEEEKRAEERHEWERREHEERLRTQEVQTELYLERLNQLRQSGYQVDSFSKNDIRNIEKAKKSVVEKQKKINMSCGIETIEVKHIDTKA